MSKDAGNRNKRVLIVDDESKVLFVLSTALRMWDRKLEVVIARSGRKAADNTKKQTFDLIITDVMMPDVDGIQLTELARSLDPGPKVVWITGYGCHKNRVESRRLDVFRCLDKPLEIGELREVAAEALRAGNTFD